LTAGWRYLVAGLGLVVALVAAAFVFAWAASDHVLRWLGEPAASERLVTGILVTGTASRPVLYVTSSDPRFGRGISGHANPVDTNSGIVSRLTRASSGWQRLDLVRGLPRSKADHAPNGLALSKDGRMLYVAQGSNTNEGAPSAYFDFTPEYALSGAILSIDLARIGERTYDLPTLDDPERAGVRDDYDPFGGNNGLNQARLDPGGAVRVHAAGLRNPYDVLLTRGGRMYTIQNGSNPGLGGRPAAEGPGGNCTNKPHQGGGRDADMLHLVRKGGYYGHPNPTRGNPRGAVETEELPVSGPDPLQCDYVEPGSRRPLATFRSSTNGLAEYTASNLGGALRGRLVAVSLSGEAYLLRLSADGRRVLQKDVLVRLAAPLDVTTLGDGTAFPGTIWVAQYASEGSIAVLEPRDARSRGWLTLPSTGLPRQEVSFVQAGGRFYLAGGGIRHQAYDPSTGAWRDVAPLPTELDHIQGVAVGGRIYYVGGLRRYPRPHVDSVYIYDTRTDEFVEGARMPRGRGAGGVVAHRGKVYYAGGLHDGRAVPWLDVYDPERNRWSQLPDMPRARDHFQAVAVSGKLWVVAGRQGSFGSELAETDTYDIASRTWQTDLAPIPTKRAGFAAAASGSRIFVIGGETPTGALNTVEAYDTRTDSWRTVDSMPTARHGIQAAVCNGGIYIAAGGRTAGGDDPSAAFEAFFPVRRSRCGPARPAARAARFALTSLRGAELTKPTSLQFGPDGRLYAAQQNGLIKAFTVAKRGAGDYEITATETIRFIQSIPNHDDDGSSATDFSAVVRAIRHRLEDL
jgi:glucose/arabinose dehydrogenase